MSKAISCGSCGGANIYEIGSSSINCEFCGTVINIPSYESPSNRQSVESRIKFKPEISKDIVSIVSDPPYIEEPHNSVRVDNGWIVHYTSKPSQFFQDRKEVKYSDRGGVLSLTEREIESVKEVFDWFSDNEIKSILVLNLSCNKLCEKFKLSKLSKIEQLDMSNNLISNAAFEITNKSIELINLQNNRINSLKSIVAFPEAIYGRRFELNLSNNNLTNSNLSEIIDVINVFKYNRKRIIIDVSNNANLDVDHLKTLLEQNIKIDASILSKMSEDLSNLRLLGLGTMTKKELEKKFQKLLFVIEIKAKNGFLFKTKYPDFNVIEKAYEYKYKKKPKFKGCFIATAAMGSYDHPQVMELRHFRDEWILKKKWGDSFVSWYYHYGAIAAKFIEKSSILKKLSYLIVVKPLVTFSRLMKKD